ncbi:MAG: hypothetical protein ACKKMV_00740 [Candidatus Nealsonbacteria bacterium]|nr:MAG: hypothetical protein IB617_01150 [Candidatus Nealsonbacteria bacterium]
MNIKKLICISFSVAFLVLLFFPGDFPDNSKFRELLDSASPDKVIIVFNSGGWGNTPLEKAKDFYPIIEGIEKTLNDLGYKSIIVPYRRTEDSFLGKVEGIREFLTSFKNQSTKLTHEIEYFQECNPDSKIVIAGLSSGAAFVDKVMEKISEKEIKNVFAIEAGIPFWEKALNSENVLLLDNEGRDSLSKKEIKTLFFSLFEAPFKLVLAKISGGNLPFSHAFRVPGHDYFWNSSSTGSKIATFLEDKFALQDF